MFCFTILFYRLEQFNDVLLQENSLHQENGIIKQMASPFLDLHILEYVAKNKSLPLKALKVPCWTLAALQKSNCISLLKNLYELA